jgi:hypothetical protein
MKGSQGILYDSADAFFELEGNHVMYLSFTAALDVCDVAAVGGWYVTRVEGGIWHKPGFEARVDCIWDGTDGPVDLTAAITNNAKAAAFIRGQRKLHDAFVISARRIEK